MLKWSILKCHNLPRKVTIHVAKCHACHAKWRSMSPIATPATQTAAATTTKRDPREGAQCHKCHKCHACHAECTLMSPSTTPATQSDGRCCQVPRLPRKQPHQWRSMSPSACHANSRGDHGAKWGPSAPPEAAQCHKCHACHAKWRSMLPSATPADVAKCQ